VARWQAECTSTVVRVDGKQGMEAPESPAQSRSRVGVPHSQPGSWHHPRHGVPRVAFATSRRRSRHPCSPNGTRRCSPAPVRDLSATSACRISPSMTSGERALRELDTRAPRHDRPQPGLTGDREPVDLGAGGRPPHRVDAHRRTPRTGPAQSAPPRRLRKARPLPSRPWHAPGPAPDPRWPRLGPPRDGHGQPDGYPPRSTPCDLLRAPPDDGPPGTRKTVAQPSEESITASGEAPTV
jgi:hypothetical protein